MNPAQWQHGIFVLPSPTQGLWQRIYHINNLDDIIMIHLIVTSHWYGFILFFVLGLPISITNITMINQLVILGCPYLPMRNRKLQDVTSLELQLRTLDLGVCFMGSPQVTMAFDTKSWSSMTTGWFGVPPWIRKPSCVHATTSCWNFFQESEFPQFFLTSNDSNVYSPNILPSGNLT